MTPDWTPQDDKALEARVRYAVSNLDTLRYRGCCLLCGVAVGHDDRCDIQSVVAGLKQHQQEQRQMAEQIRGMASAVAKAAKSKAKVEAAWKHMKGMA